MKVTMQLPSNSASLLLSVDVSKLKTNTHLEALYEFLEAKCIKLGVTYVSQYFSQSPTSLRDFIIFNHLYSAIFDLIHSFFLIIFIPPPAICFGYICFYIFQKCSPQADTLSTMAEKLFCIFCLLDTHCVVKSGSCDLFRHQLSVSSGNSSGHTVSTFLYGGIKMLFPGNNLGILVDPFVSCLGGMTPSKFIVEGIENYLS